MATRSSLAYANETQKYTLAGVLFGFLFPFTATAVKFFLTGAPFTLYAIISLHLSDPLILIIDTAPLFLGLFASIAGRRQDMLLRLTNQQLQLREREISGVQKTLEDQVSERTQYLDKRSFELETVAEITHEISIVRDLNSLINLSANLIHDRFGYYFTGMFLLDEQGEYAVLRAASGGNAEGSLERELRLDLTQINPLAIALRTGKPYISDDISRDELLTVIPTLPQAVSRILLPIQSKKILLGVLDIQTDKPVVFDAMSIRTLQMFTDQLATVMENIRLTQDAEKNLMELNRISRLQSRAAWRKSIDQHASAFEFDGRKIRPIPRSLPEGFLRRLESGRSVVIDEMADNSGGVRKTLLVPLMILNHLIGVIGLEQEDPAHEWSEEEIAIAEAAANRAALTLENVRLLEESQRRAYKEQAISDASARIGAALNIENILDITAEEIDRVLGNAEVILQINNQDRQSESRMLSE